ncbi:Major facilitator superfamily domain general substrate transporter [Penicillium cf. griseofulvum]|uniref:Major facilitator superfamily domain general substrate transporter n=1 Tax=Penicillium cf. griseofulvum TaxID=2972120 RepID=A0A9W9T1V2_9EURO|nr:Major facilitator superfamily domain general substrate transporter [Penicillium cf. griseofulvum]
MCLCLCIFSAILRILYLFFGAFQLFFDEIRVAGCPLKSDPGTTLATIGLFIFAWPIYRNIHWIASIIGSAVFGVG